MGGKVPAGPSFLQSLIGKMCPNFSFAFFYEMVGQVWTQGETEERLRKKTKCIVPTGPRDGRHWGGQRTRRVLRPQPLLGVPWKRQSRANSLGLTCMKNLGRLWAI